MSDCLLCVTEGLGDIKDSCCDFLGGMAPSCLMHGYSRFVWVYCFHLQGRIILMSSGFQRFTIYRAVICSIFCC